MGRPREKLDRGAEAAEVVKRLRSEREGWKRERLMALKHGLEGEMSLEEIGQAIGRARSCIQKWFDAYRKGGLEGLLKRRYRAGIGSMLEEPVANLMKQELGKGTWRRAEDARRWLEKEHGVRVALRTVYKYLGKCGARLKVPRPCHAKKETQEVETFKAELAQKLTDLNLERGRSVRLWVVDEMRYGLQPVTRRVWTLRGKRIVVPVDPTYKWGYVYGALQVAGGGAEFFYSPTVNLECSALFLNQIAERDRDAIHVVIWDGAGFHQRDGASELPENVRLILMPPYSPELNPVEKLWDIVKDGFCNRLYDSLEEAQENITSTLRKYWSDASAVFRLIGNNYLLSQANSSSVTIIP